MLIAGKNIESIKKPILLPLAVALMTLLAASLYGMHYVQQQNSTQQAYESITQAQQLFQNLLENEAQQMVFFLDPLERDRKMGREFLDKKRQDLYERALPLFRDVLREQGISHFYFITPDGRIFLRVHNPQRYDDTATHATFVKSKKLTKQTVGIEMGEFGKLSLHVVYPWFQEGKLLGFLEFGKEFSRLTPKLKKLLGAELLFSVNKNYIDRQAWEAGAQESGNKTRWDDLPHCVVVDHTLDFIPEELCGFMQQPVDQPMIQIMESRYAGRKYRGGITPLVDAGGKFIGSMAVLKDVSNREVSILAMAAYTGFSGIAIMFGVYLFFSWYVKRMDSRLFTAQASLQEALTDKESRLSLSATHLHETITRQEDIEKENKAAKSDLEESERLYRAITTTVLDAIIMIDDEDLIIYWNRAAEKIFHFSANEVIGRSCYDVIFSPPGSDVFRKEVSFLKGSGVERKVNGKSLELTATRKDGRNFPVEMSLSAVEMAGQWCAVAVFRDISERLRAQKEWETMQAQLRQAQKMEAIGTLAGGIAHDFNNILGAIMGYTELALIEISEGDPLRGHLQQVQRASRRAKELVAHILAFSRQSELTRKPVELSPIIKEALKMLRASLPTTIEIRQNIGSDLGKIMADPTQIHQVLMNLCTNAAHAMSEKGGVLEVGLSREILQDEFILKAYNIPSGEYLCLSVRDTGSGINDAVLPRIFDPFFTTKKRGEGTGMGLSVVHGIVSSHDGGIRVQGNPGEGSCFELFFPIIAAPPEEMESIICKSPPTGTECILLVDDEPTLIELGQKALSYLGYAVVTSKSSMEALDLFRSQPQKFDLIITDYTMPDMTGTALAKKILELRPDIPIILCTGFSEKISEEKVKAMGIRGYIMKPVSIHNLANICRRILDS